MKVWQRLDNALLLTPKILYFSMSSVYSTFYFFRPQFCKDYLGMNEVQFGDSIAVLGIIGVLTIAFWSSLADYTGYHRFILAMLSLGMGGSFQLFYIKVHNTYAYLYAIFVISLFAVCFSSILSLSDFQILKILSRQPILGKEMYGRQRMFGTLSYGFTTFILGVLIQKFGIQSMIPFMLGTSIIFTVLLFLLGERDLGASRKMRATDDNHDSHIDDDDDYGDHHKGNINGTVTKNYRHQKGKKRDKAKQPSKCSLLLKLVTDADFSFFLLFVFLMGISCNIKNNFLSIFLLEKVGIPEAKAGFGVACGSIVAVTMFFFGALLYERIGVYWMLIIAQIAITLRGWIYAMFPSASPHLYWVVYMIEMLNGMSFALTHLSGVKIAAASAPEGLEATAQGLYANMYTQLPVVLAAAVGGRIVNSLGLYWLFRGTAIMSTVALIMVVVKFGIAGKLFRKR